jgi:hypothetical protein
MVLLLFGYVDTLVAASEAWRLVTARPATAVRVAG